MKRKEECVFLKEVEEHNKNIEVVGKFINTRTKIDVRCKICGYEYKVSPNSLCRGVGCPKCVGLAKKTTEEFKNEMYYINPKIAVLGEYTNSKGKILVRCKDCNNEWYSTPNSLLCGRGCGKCSGHLRITNEDFIKKMNVIHPKIQVIGTYKNNHTRVKCFCNRCKRYFYGMPHSMINAKSGCLYCSKSNSRGEIAVLDWLTKNNIEFIKEYRFKECRNKYPLPFDFYLPKRNTIIEFDGKQHYEKCDYFNGELGYLQTINNDRIKDRFCNKNKINLIRIPYWEIDNIDTILNDKLTI